MFDLGHRDSLRQPRRGPRALSRSPRPWSARQPPSCRFEYSSTSYRACSCQSPNHVSLGERYCLVYCSFVIWERFGLLGREAFSRFPFGGVGEGAETRPPSWVGRVFSVYSSGALRPAGTRMHANIGPQVRSRIF
ncbi:hypothetical protein NDU88_005481 [Pleurodeles waltl]|uniref:Uncharacterized protein n=1 Tax=Pleurodeles waltl TaxID=8319 RepID=A0AAV7M9F8_PLEWA|nr:hypothetical protein NDU88_005481 [Pleurodeles waltl]